MLANISVGVAASAINKESKGRVLPVIQARNLNKGPRTACATACYFNLSTCKVKLGVRTLCSMNGNMLDSHQVLARRSITRQHKADFSFIPAAPICISERVLWSTNDILVDFEPVSITLVLTHVTRSPGHVNSHGAGMKNFSIVPEFKANSLSRIHLSHLGTTSIGP